MNEQILFILVATVLTFFPLHNFQNNKLPVNFILFFEPLGECALQEDPKSLPSLFLCLSLDQPAWVSLLRTLLPASKCTSLAPGGTSGYGMFWRQLAQGRRRREERWVFISIVADFPNEEPNYSSPLVSLCLWIKQMCGSSCDREGPWFWRASAGVVPALELLLKYPCVVQREVIFLGTF